MKSIKNSILIVITLVTFAMSLFAQETTKEVSIHNAVGRGKLDLVKKLLSQNPKLINLKNKEGWTPLFIASWAVQKEMVELLVEKGAEINICGNDGYTPLHNIIAGANFSGDAYGIMVFLVKKGADVNAKSYEGLTPLHWAAQSGNVNIAEYLLSNGAKINAQNNSGETPLHLSCKSGFNDFTNKIIQLGANTKTLNNSGASCLMESVINGFPDIVQLLLSEGANINIYTKYKNRSLLHLASIYGNLEIVDLLILNGLNVNQNDSLGNTPINYAFQYCHKEIVTLLKNNGANLDTRKKDFCSFPILSKNKDEAIIWKIWGGWAVKTINQFFILNYWEKKQLPNSTCLANGCINTDEIGTLKSYYLTYRYHPQTGGKKIYDMEKKFNDITYIQHKKLYTKEVENSILFSARESKVFEDLKITTISQPGGLGFFLEADNIKIFNPFNNIIREPQKQFKDEVDFIATKSSYCDIAFLEINSESNDMQNKSLEGVFYSIDKLKPKAVFLSIEKEILREETIKKLEEKYKDINFYSFDFPGDHYLFSK